MDTTPRMLPPAIPPARRAAKLLLGLWPFAVWCGAAVAAIWLYFGEAGHGHALACEWAQELQASPEISGRIATVDAVVGQSVQKGDLIATLDANELELHADEAALRQRRICAPAAGIVSAIVARPGEWRAPGEAIARIVLPSTGRADAFATDRQIAVIQVGTLVTLRPRDLVGPPLDGKVVLVAPLVEEVPVRLRAIPTIPQWGRRITIEAAGLRNELLGAIYDVRFR